MARSISPTEAQLKVRLLNELRRSGRISSTTTLTHELPLGNTGVRADLVYLAKSFCGVEIKSDRDSLKRLERQLAIYRQYFDRTILVIGSKHWSPLQQLNLDLDKVELWVASGLSLRRERQGITERKVDVHADLLNARQQTLLEKSVSKNASELFQEAFRERFKSTSAAFWEATKDQKIETAHLALLSRFDERRRLEAELKAKQEKERKAWEEAVLQPTQSSSVS
jgi:hypothetical protein